MSKETGHVPEYDFCGWATRANVRCTDGRVIEENAFAHCDGQEVSMAWNHNNMSPYDILGKVRLKSRPQGLYAYGYFNDTDAGQTAKRLVQHGDIGSMSICATGVREKNGHVYYGNIREVSLVQSGANKEAIIEYVIQHSDESEPSMMMFALGDDLCEFWHSEDGKPVPKEADEDEDDEKDEIDEALDKLTPEQKEKLLSKLSGNKKFAHSDEEDASAVEDTDENGEGGEAEPEGNENDDDDEDLTEEEVMSIFDNLPQEKKDAIFAYINKVVFDDTIKHSEYNAYDIENIAELAEVMPELDGPQRQSVIQVLDYSMKHREELVDAIMHSDDSTAEGDDDMRYNPFEGNKGAEEQNYFTHEDANEVLRFAEKNSMRLSKAFENYMSDNDKVVYHRGGTFSHAESDAQTIVADETDKTYGINGIDFLFPDPHLLNNRPKFIKRDTEWVSEVFNKASKVPAGTIKSMFANIEEDEARAKGYIKGTQKLPEIIPMLKRTTAPTTVYKMQQFDRDDLIDIDWDLVSWIKEEMMIMFREEVSRAILVGDGRQNTSNIKIKEDCIRPIWTDESLYTYRKVVTPGADDYETAEKIMEAIIRARRYYRGSGNLTYFTTEDYFNDMLLSKDKIGRRLYNTAADVASAMRVNKIVTVPIMENLTRNGNKLAGIAVNMQDYTIGIKDKGRTTWFDDFDIDFNQYKYLVESRMSGALTTPYSAIVIEVGSASTGG